MRTFLVLTLAVVAAMVFLVLSIAAFNIYPFAGAITFSTIVGSTFMWVLYLVKSTFRTLDRSRFLREYNARPIH